MKIDYLYILDDNKNIIQVSSIDIWSAWREKYKEKIIVKRDKINGNIVSTVFLGIDHNFEDNDKYKNPILFETIVFFDKPNDQEYLYRYETWKQAEYGHHKAVELVINGCKEYDVDNGLWVSEPEATKNG